MTITTDDHIAIRSLYARYNHAVDIAGDAGAVTDCFVPKGGVYDHGRLGRFEGRDAIQAFMQATIVDQQGMFQHWNDNLLIDGSPESAHGTAYVMTIDLRLDPPAVARVSVYQDELVRTVDGWRFASRRVGYPPIPR
jgi:hypothetical protein